MNTNEYSVTFTFTDVNQMIAVVNAERNIKNGTIVSIDEMGQVTYCYDLKETPKQQPKETPKETPKEAPKKSGSDNIVKFSFSNTTKNPEQTQKQQQPEQDQATPEQAPMTREQANARFMELVKQHGTGKAKALFKSYGVTKLQQIPDEKLGDVIGELEDMYAIV